MTTSIETSVAEAAWDAVMRLVLRAADLDDIKPLNDKDAELIRDLKQAVGDVFDFDIKRGGVEKVEPAAG